MHAQAADGKRLPWQCAGARSFSSRLRAVSTLPAPGLRCLLCAAPPPRRLLKREHLDLRITPYQVLATSGSDGLIEFVPSQVRAGGVVWVRASWRRHPQSCMHRKRGGCQDEGAA